MRGTNIQSGQPIACLLISLDQVACLHDKRCRKYNKFWAFVTSYSSILTKPNLRLWTIYVSVNMFQDLEMTAHTGTPVGSGFQGYFIASQWRMTSSRLCSFLCIVAGVIKLKYLLTGVSELPYELRFMLYKCLCPEIPSFKDVQIYLGFLLAKI